MRIKITITVLVLLVFALLTNAQSEFKTSTSNTFWPALDLSTLYFNPEEVDNWKVEGELHKVPDKNLYLLYNDESLISSRISGIGMQSLGVRLWLESNGIGSTGGNYTLSIEYEDGVIVTQDTGVSDEIPLTPFDVIFENVRPLDFVIRIKGQAVRGNTGYITVMSSVAVNVTYLCKPNVSTEKAGLKIFKDSNYDSLIVNIEHQEKSTLDIDTLYYNDFEDNDLKGAIAYPSASLDNNYCLVDSKSLGDAILSIPLNLSGNDNVYLSFKSGWSSKYESDTIKIRFQGNLIETIYKKLYNGWHEYSVKFDTDVHFGTLEFICDDKNSKNILYLDDILIYQKSKYRYVSLPSFPKTTDSDLSVDGLYCNDEYRVQVQYTKDKNEYGEEVVTSIADTSVVTLGDYHEIPSDESYVLDGDYEGTLLMYPGASLEGNYRIMGELCYVLNYRSGEWESIGCPFKPYLIGAFIDGEPYYLRENVDFHLQHYSKSEELGNYYFDSASEFLPYQGYILKVPEDIVYDNNQLFIFSEKGIEVNEENVFSYDKLYSQVCNPYTYPISIDAWKIFNADCLYKYDGTVFRLFTSNDVIQPFESIIVYNGGLNSAPKVIKLDNISHIDSLNDDMFISVYDNSFVVNNYTGQVCVYDINGVKVFDQYVSEGKEIILQHGIYIVNVGGTYKKIVL